MIAETGVVLAEDAWLATTLIARLIGLIGRKSLPRNCALGIGSCDWVHTFGVRQSIDIAYCDKTGRVLRLVEGLGPNRVASRARGAAVAWETAAGGFSGRIHEGQRLILKPAIKPEPKIERQKVE